MKKTLYIVSTGPGNAGLLTIEAKEALEKADIIVGYEKYLTDLAPLIKDKETYKSSMTEEIARCHKAIDLALENKKVALVSNGDINVFGLASLVVELMDERELWDDIELVSLPGVPSVLAAASKAGAPIGQDFALVSLSDRLTPIEDIEKRIEASLRAGFILIVINPKGKRRIKPYEIFLKHLSNYKSYPVVVAQNVSRENEVIHNITVEKLIQKGSSNEDVHMSTLLIIGNKSSRFTKNNKVLTPRGYLNKYELDGSKISSKAK